jgi:hypothetical protein
VVFVCLFFLCVLCGKNRVSGLRFRVLTKNPVKSAFICVLILFLNLQFPTCNFQLETKKSRLSLRPLRLCGECRVDI